MNTNTSPNAPLDPAAEWHAYIRSAPNFAEAQTRIEQAVAAGVDFAELNAEVGA